MPIHPDDWDPKKIEESKTKMPIHPDDWDPKKIEESKTKPPISPDEWEHQQGQDRENLSGIVNLNYYEPEKPELPFYRVTANPKLAELKSFHILLHKILKKIEQYAKKIHRIEVKAVYTKKVTPAEPKDKVYYRTVVVHTKDKIDEMLKSPEALEPLLFLTLTKSDDQANIYDTKAKTTGPTMVLGNLLFEIKYPTELSRTIQKDIESNFKDAKVNTSNWDSTDLFMDKYEEDYRKVQEDYDKYIKDHPKAKS